MFFASFRWLVDVGRYDEGMTVIADLRGGSLDDPIAREEFREIKEVVEQEVRSTLAWYFAVLIQMRFTAHIW